jgi:BioD-like phosphotransacetylase family protein
MSWLRRSVDKVFITGGDRADLVLMALETAPSAVILTGNIYPSAQVTATAERRGVPLLLVGEDTYTTVTRLEPLDGASPITISAAKAELTRNLVSRYIDWAEALRGYVEIKRS